MTLITLERIRQRKRTIERLAQSSRLTDIRVFGSVAREEQGAASDLDVLVAPCEGATLFDIAQFEIDLEALLRIPVSVVSIASLDQIRDARILNEAVPL